MSLETSLARMSSKLVKQFGIEGTLVGSSQSTPVNYVWSNIEFNEVSDGDIKWTDRKIILDGSPTVDTDQLFTDADGVVYTIIKATPSYLKNTHVITTVFLRKFVISSELTVTLYSWVDSSSADGFADTPLTSLGAVTAAQADVGPYDTKFVAAAEISRANAVFILDATLVTSVTRAFILFNNILYRELGRNGNRLIMEAVDRTSYGV